MAGAGAANETGSKLRVTELSGYDMSAVSMQGCTSNKQEPSSKYSCRKALASIRDRCDAISKEPRFAYALQKTQQRWVVTDRAVRVIRSVVRRITCDLACWLGLNAGVVDGPLTGTFNAPCATLQAGLMTATGMTLGLLPNNLWHARSFKPVA